METAYNLILVGGTGTGKTHLATAIVGSCYAPLRYSGNRQRILPLQTPQKAGSKNRKSGNYWALTDGKFWALIDSLADQRATGSSSHAVV
jgi:hypothetical protein